jgi:hypothetical protein
MKPVQSLAALGHQCSITYQAGTITSGSELSGCGSAHPGYGRRTSCAAEQSSRAAEAVCSRSLHCRAATRYLPASGYLADPTIASQENTRGIPERGNHATCHTTPSVALARSAVEQAQKGRISTWSAFARINIQSECSGMQTDLFSPGRMAVPIDPPD